MADVVEAGPDRPRRRLPGRLLLAAAVVAGLLVVADGAVAEREATQVLARLRAGEQASVYADRRLAGTVEYTSGQMTSPSAPAALRADLRQLVQREAQGQERPVRTARDRVRAVRVLAWHGDERAARAAAVRLLDARLQRLQEVAADVDRLYERRPEPAASARRARAALSGLVPRRDLDALLPP